MKVRVPVFGTVGKSVLIDTGRSSAPTGATVGKDLRLPNGTVPTLAELAQVFADALRTGPQSGSSVSVTLWKLIRGVPENVQKVAALNTVGLVERQSSGDWVTRQPKLGALDDVDATPPEDGQVLTWDGINQRWMPDDPTGGGGGGAIATLSDVLLESPLNDGHILRWDDMLGFWTNAAFPNGRYVRGASFTNGTSPVFAPTNAVPVTITEDCTIRGVLVLTQGGTGSCVLDIKRSTLAGFPPTSSICGGSKPTISNGVTYQDTTLAGWSTALSEGDTLLIELESSATFTVVNLFLVLEPVGSTALDGYTDERVLDVVDGALQNTNTVTWTYDNALRTLSADVSVFTDSTPGVVPPSGGGTDNFLRADGTWAAPPGSGGGVSWPLLAPPGTYDSNYAGADAPQYSFIGYEDTGLGFAVQGGGAHGRVVSLLVDDATVWHTTDIRFTVRTRAWIDHNGSGDGPTNLSLEVGAPNSSDATGWFVHDEDQFLDRILGHCVGSLFGTAAHVFYVNGDEALRITTTGALGKLSATGTASNTAGALNFGSDTASSASSGFASALPATPAGYLVWDLSGTTIKIPYYQN